ELVNGLFRENYSKISPILTRDGKLVQRPLVTLQAGGQSISPLTGEQVPEMGSSSSNTGAITSGKANPVNTRLFFSERFQTFLQAIQFFDTRFSQKFVNQSRVFKVGNGEQITAPKNGDFEKVTFTDPGTGVTYGAIHDKSGSDDSLAVDLVQNGAKLAEKYKNATGDGQRREIRRSLDDTVREVNIIADAVNLLGSPLR
ncbi:MAG: hypothetical protein ABEL76_15755, partial [Bradymonadaceae bacterium]